MKIKVKKERSNVYIPEKKSLKAFIKSKKFKKIHNFIPTCSIVLGADHLVNSVMKDIDRADRLAIFTDPDINLGHSLSLIYKEELECYDIGNINKKDLKL